MFLLEIAYYGSHIQQRPLIGPVGLDTMLNAIQTDVERNMPDAIRYQNSHPVFWADCQTVTFVEITLHRLVGKVLQKS